MGKQIGLFQTEYERLCDQRDVAAYRALGAITAAIAFCKQGDAEKALTVLNSARERYDVADAQLQQLKLQGGNHVHAAA